METVFTKTALLGMSREELVVFTEGLGEKAFRGKQIFQWLYAHGVENFSEMTSLAASLRARLHDVAQVNPLEVVQ
ncbi:MAG: 23S rRNA (adenine(2503)-C(2))-methyltransferase RlmN, partial [candidate division KSB1 bacterium]